MESFATPYPLIFFDGEEEHDKGFVGVHSVLTFKRFQSLLSQKTGIPANQLCAVFVCRKTFKGSEKKQRLPINGNTNFSILLNQHNPSRERDCYFLVSMKRSKKERKESRKRSAESDMPDEWELKNEIATFESNTDPSNDAVEETILPHPSGSAQKNAPSLRSTWPRHHVDNGSYTIRAGDSDVSKVILKRGNTSFLQRHGWNHAKECKTSNKTCVFLGDEHVQLNSPRFAALRPEDQRDLNWKWEDALPGLPRVNLYQQWGTHKSFGVPHNMKTQTDSSYLPYNHDSFDKSYSEEHVLQRRDRTSDTYNTSGNLGDLLIGRHCTPFKSRDFRTVNRPRPSIFAPHTPSLSNIVSHVVPDVQGERDAFLKGNPHLQCLMPGDAFKMLEAARRFSDIQAMVSEDMTQSLVCQLCIECRRRRVTPIPFHWCVEDVVTNGFRGPSPAGPIGRRVKALQMEAIA